MASSVSYDPTAILAAQYTQVSTFCSWSATALMLYDIVITLGEELELILAIGIFVFSYISPSNPGPVYGCLFPSSQGSVYGLVLAVTSAVILAYNTFLFLVTLIAIGPNCQLRSGLHTLFPLLLRDGTLYFLLICGTMIMATILPLASASMTFLPIRWVTVVPPLATCRMFLSLRAHFAPMSADISSPSADTQSGIGSGGAEAEEGENSFELADVEKVREGPKTRAAAARL